MYIYKENFDTQPTSISNFCKTFLAHQPWSILGNLLFSAEKIYVWVPKLVVFASHFKINPPLSVTLILCLYQWNFQIFSKLFNSVNHNTGMYSPLFAPEYCLIHHWVCCLVPYSCLQWWVWKWWTQIKILWQYINFTHWQLSTLKFIVF